MTSLPRLPRLKPTIELLAAENGDVHLYRGGDDDFVVKGGGETALALLESLDGTRDVRAVGAALVTRGIRARADDVAAEIAKLSALGLVEDAADHAGLAPERLERHDRQLRYFGDRAPAGVPAAEYQRKLAEATVVVLGVGGLGGSVALALAASGVGRLRLVDGDRVELSNLNRQVLFCEGDLGRAKVDCAAARLRALDSALGVEAVATTLAGVEDIRAVVGGADLVVDAVDAPVHVIERWVNEACFAEAVPYIAMSQYPPRVRFGPLFVPGETGCYACQESAWRESYPLYDELATRRRASSSAAAAVASTSLLVGGQVAAEVVHHLTGLVRPATLGRSVVFDTVTMSVETEPVVRRKGCSVCM